MNGFTFKKRLILNRSGRGGPQYGELPELTRRPDGAVVMRELEERKYFLPRLRTKSGLQIGVNQLGHKTRQKNGSHHCGPKEIEPYKFTIRTEIKNSHLRVNSRYLEDQKRTLAMFLLPVEDEGEQLLSNAQKFAQRKHCKVYRVLLLETVDENTLFSDFEFK
ncbi:hypothetical protein STEG23_029574 [Scotinomys teguina]